MAGLVDKDVGVVAVLELELVQVADTAACALMTMFLDAKFALSFPHSLTTDSFTNVTFPMLRHWDFLVCYASIGLSD